MMNRAYEKNVFINCPFDEEYFTFFHAMLFTISDCGFFPRCALEKSDASEIRISKIYDLIAECKLGIHDLSRTTLSEKSGLPRFNMPLELGIFLGAKYLGEDKQKQKSCLVFDKEPYRYQMYLSDIAGQDIHSHNDDLKTFITNIRNWLVNYSETNIPSGSILHSRFNRFQQDLESYCNQSKHRIEELTYFDYLNHISKFVIGKDDILKTGLQMRWGNELKNPPLTHVRECIEALNGNNDSFAILSRSEYTYVQCVGGKLQGYRVEFQDGSVNEHYYCTKNLKRKEVIKIFQNYREGNDIWRTDYDWEKDNFK